MITSGEEDNYQGDLDGEGKKTYVNIFGGKTLVLVLSRCNRE